MPSWLVNIILPYVVPALIQGVSPVLIEYLKKAVQWLNLHLPKSAMLVVAATVAEGVNQASAWLAGSSLPYGLAPLVAVFLNELGADFGKQPPTPGMPDS